MATDTPTTTSTTAGQPGVNGYVNASGNYVPPTQQTVTPTPSGTNGHLDSSGNYIPPTNGNTPISADSLTGQSVNPLTIPPVSSSSTTAPIVPTPAGTTTGADGNATVTPPTNNTNSSTDTQSWIKQQLANLGGVLGTKSAVTTQLQNDTGLAAKTTQAATDYNTYNQAKVALAQKLADMKANNPTGQFGSDVAGDIARVEREGNANLANLAVQAQASQGLLDAAQKTINDKLDAQFKPVQDQIDFLTKFNSVNNNDLTDSQKEQLTLKAEQLKTSNASVQTATSDIHQKLLAAGAPASVYNAIDKVSNDYIAGKIDATTAQSQMYAAAGKWGATTTIKAGNIVTGTGGQYSPDVYQTYNSISDTNKNTPQSAFGGLTKNGVFNAAQLYLSENGKMPSLGLGSAAETVAKRNAIVNIGGAIADSLGMTLPQISAMYKANSSSATQIVQRVAKIDAVTNSLTNQFPRLAELADKVQGLGISEQDLTATKAQIDKKFNNVNANNYIELLQTVRSDYSAMQSAVAGGRGGQYFSEAADKAIPLGGTGDVYRGLQQTILMSAANAEKGTQDEANALIGNIGTNSMGNRSQTVQSNGQTFTVGQVYTDKSGSNWTVDASGKWAKQ